MFIEVSQFAFGAFLFILFQALISSIDQNAFQQLSQVCRWVYCPL